MPRVIITPRAVRDLDDLTTGLGLVGDARKRVQKTLGILERFPLAGRALTGNWQDTRFLIGPWPWMIIVYLYDKPDDAVYVVAIHDGRSGASPTGNR